MSTKRKGIANILTPATSNNVAFVRSFWFSPAFTEFTGISSLNSTGKEQGSVQSKTKIILLPKQELWPCCCYVESWKWNPCKSGLETRLMPWGNCQLCHLKKSTPKSRSKMAPLEAVMTTHRTADWRRAVSLKTLNKINSSGNCDSSGGCRKAFCHQYFSTSCSLSVYNVLSFDLKQQTNKQKRAKRNKDFSWNQMHFSLPRIALFQKGNKKTGNLLQGVLSFAHPMKGIQI